MIERLPTLNQQAYNPIRSHISIQFETCRNEDERVSYIADYLAGKLNVLVSRVLVFVRTRRLAEDTAEELAERMPALAGGVGYFHAGLSASEREEAVEDFKTGRKPVLCTTKAFGMGMDIPNVHYVFHLGPSSTFEDFLQEIGRAGRNTDYLQKAGLSEANPIRTVCLLTAQDFSRLRDLSQKTQLNWQQVQATFSSVKKLFEGFQNPTQQVIPLSLSHFTQIGEFSEHVKSGSAATNFRLALHWLERAERIRLGFFMPAHLEFSNAPLRQHKDDYESLVSDPSVKSLFVLLLNTADLSEPVTTLPLYKIQKGLGLRSGNAVFRAIALGQQQGFIKLNHTVKISVARGRDAEQNYIKKQPLIKHPLLDISMRLAWTLVKRVASGQRAEFDSEYINRLVKHAIDDTFKPANFPWYEKDVRKIADARKSYEKKGKFGGYARGLNGAFQVLQSIPDVTHKVEFADSAAVQSIYRKQRSTDSAIDTYLKKFRRDCHWLLNCIYKGNTTNPDFRLNLVETLLGLTTPDFAYLEKLLSVLQRHRLITIEGSLLPMAIECTLIKEQDIDPLTNDADKTVQDRFVLTQKLRKVRLAVLAGFAEIQAEDYPAYINDYFQCADYEQIVNLLDRFLPANSQLLSEYREEALRLAEEKLNEQQRAVYEYNVNANLNVVAGPGSGKTHTLTLKVARLIHKEQTPPAQILVLAYNRAVVIELRDRISTLFKKLGYHKLTTSLKIFTFHGFIKFCLQEELDGVEFNQYANRFIEKWQTEPGLITSRMGAVKHIFVDEFQDITSSRLEVLKIIANPAQQRRITVIGDPNQSIYGFDRKIESDPVSPKPFYDKFDGYFQPAHLQLTVNYRSFPEIIRQAQGFVNLNGETFGIPPLTANAEIPETWRIDPYCEMLLPNGDNWIDKLKSLLAERSPTDRPYQEVAIMFRSNDELYRAYQKIKAALPADVRIRIQGVTEDFLCIREIAFIVREFITPRLEQAVADTLHAEYKSFIAGKRIPDVWDLYLMSMLEACLIEFEKGSKSSDTYTDLLDFLRDITQKDDGQLAKLYHAHAGSLSSYSDQTTIVLTTMHKVKGLEFDAVLIPPSYAALPLKGGTEEENYEDIEEERRLRFVALSRAKYRLVTFDWQREAALTKGEPWSLPVHMTKKLGRPAPAGLDKFYISWVATQWDETFDFINSHVGVGNEVILKSFTDMRNNFKWGVWVSGKQVGLIKIGEMKGFGGPKIIGFAVTSVVVYTYEETVAYDLKHGTTFALRWKDHARETGYTYIVDFAGYGKAV